ncbi:excisionase family DNA-binding protein [Labrenzia sp. THAF35]|uniref:excisionase family DNA-binding protein n=1 Tax=Labrenzia sp. THAF35 TaxID=2587854 RepID=UPI001AD91C88|nr:excisionase family DNA-binding protein [Labrenzia sp. THAF35]
MALGLESIKELADRTGWPISRIRKLVENRELRHVRIGGGIFIPDGAIEEFIKNNTIPPIGETAAHTTSRA